MQTNLTLIANFVPNPFPGVRGSYVGLMANTNNVSPNSAGFFAVAVTRSWRFTGRLLLAGQRYGFSGRFDLDGGATVSVRRGLSAPFALKWHLDLVRATDQVTGSVSDGNWTAALAGDRNIFRSIDYPAQQTGLRSFVLERTHDSATVAAGLSRISAGGITTVRGNLSDGRRFATSSALSRNGDCPFYLSLNHGNEVVIGWLNFPSGSPAASGTVSWVQTGTNAFATTLQASSAQP